MIQGYITQDGVLVLQAGLMTEAYALKCWMANFQPADGTRSIVAIPDSKLALEHPSEPEPIL